MDEALDTPAARVLRTILREGPMNQRRFMEVSGHAIRHAKALRERLEARGYLVVGENPTRRITRSIEIDLTPAGRKWAELSVQQEEIDERLKRQHGTK